MKDLVARIMNMLLEAQETRCETQTHIRIFSTSFKGESDVQSHTPILLKKTNLHCTLLKCQPIL